MKIERLGHNKIRIFLTFDDLVDRGIEKDDMWREDPKVHELFSEMMDQAYSELGFDASGPLAVEVFSMPAQGMVVIVTRGNSMLHSLIHDDEDDSFDMELDLERESTVIFEFEDFEHVIQLAKMVYPMLLEGGTLYAYEQKYMLLFEPRDMEDVQFEAIIALFSEYGEVSTYTEAVLKEYGKLIIENQAIYTLCNHFA